MAHPTIPRHDHVGCETDKKPMAGISGTHFERAGEASRVGNRAKPTVEDDIALVRVEQADIARPRRDRHANAFKETRLRPTPKSTPANPQSVFGTMRNPEMASQLSRSAVQPARATIEKVGDPLLRTSIHAHPVTNW